MTHEKLNSESAPEPVGAYPHARRVGDLLFMSGIGPRKKGTKDIPGVTLDADDNICLLYTSPSPRDLSTSRMPSSA